MTLLRLVGALMVTGSLAVGAAWSWATGQQQLAAVLAIALAALIAWHSTRGLDRDEAPR